MTATPASISIVALWDGVNTARYFESAATSRCGLVRRRNSPPAPAECDTEVVMVVDPLFTHPDRLRCAPCPTVGILIDVHQELTLRRAYARYFDHVFVAQPSFLQAIESVGHPSVHALPLACDPAVHYVPGLARDIDVAFIGKLGALGSDRHDVLIRVLTSFNTNNFRRAYSPSEMGEVYSNAKIVFNKSIRRDVNMRFFEGLASGALLVTDRVGNELSDLATEGVHFVGYQTADEAIEKIRYYLAHAAKREMIARAGQALAFERHSYAARLETIFAVLKSRPCAKAPARAASSREELQFRTECLRIQGAHLRDAALVLAEGHWSGESLSNIATAAARGIVRPLRQRFHSR